eukprot:UC1_evm1s1799
MTSDKTTSDTTTTTTNTTTTDVTTTDAVVPPDGDCYEDILGSGSLLKQVIVEGEGDRRPQQGDRVCIRATVSYETASTNYSEEEKEYTFRLGEEDVCQAFDLLVALMLPGETCLAKSDPRFHRLPAAAAAAAAAVSSSIVGASIVGAENEAKAGNNDESSSSKNTSSDSMVAAAAAAAAAVVATDEGGDTEGQQNDETRSNSMIEYRITLESVTESTPVELASAEERLEWANHKRYLGVDKFRGGDFEGAAESFRRATRFLDPCEEDPAALRTELDDAAVAIWRNLAACQLKLGAPRRALASAETVLMKEPSNIKALYLKARAQFLLKDTDEALATLDLLDAAAEMAATNVIKDNDDGGDGVGEGGLLRQSKSQSRPSYQRDPSITRLRKQLLSAKRAEAIKEKQLYKRMIGGSTMGLSSSSRKVNKKSEDAANISKWWSVWMAIAAVVVAVVAAALYVINIDESL